MKRKSYVYRIVIDIEPGSGVLPATYVRFYRNHYNRAGNPGRHVTRASLLRAQRAQLAMLERAS